MSDVAYEDLLRQIRLSGKLVPFAGILRLFPDRVPIDPDIGTHRRLEAMILALTPEERRNPDLIGNGERISAISRDSGESENDVGKFFRQFRVMSDLRRAQL